MESASKKAELAKARRIILTHGWNSTSYQILNPGIERWFSTANDAVVGFSTAAGLRIVVGAPVCSPSRLRAVADEFENESKPLRVCYLAAESRLENHYAASKLHSRILLGAQPVWDPREWRSMVAGARNLRSQINRATNKGVRILQWTTDEAFENPRLRECLASWLAGKGLPPLHFMVEPETLSRLYDRRLFVAERDGVVEGFVTLSPVATRRGWLFEQFTHRPNSPNGTVELLIDAAMNAIADENSEYATLGLAPLSVRAPRPDFENPIWLRILFGVVHRYAGRFYNFDGLDAFKTKLRPTRWEPIFAIYNRPRVSPRIIYAVGSVFSGKHPFRFLAGGIARVFSRGLITRN